MIRKLAVSSLLVLTSLCVSLLALELLYRLWKLGPSSIAFEIKPLVGLGEKENLLERRFPIELDPQLGWKPKPGKYVDPHYWKEVTILPDGTRSSGEISRPLRREKNPCTILALGDSFTFGDQVRDEETWPAVTQELTGCRVINAGVSAYGIDQAYLRGKELIRILHPTVVVLGVIYDDIVRTRFSVRQGLPKPYFTSDGTFLTLHPIPSGVYEATPSTSLEKRRKDTLRKFLRHSHLAKLFLMRWFPEYWLLGVENKTEWTVNVQEVSCKLVAGLGKTAKGAGARPFLLSIYTRSPHPEELEPMKQLMECVNASGGMEVMDWRSEHRRLASQDSQHLESLYDGHLSAKGNRTLATFVALQLLRRQATRVREAEAPGGP